MRAGAILAALALIAVPAGGQEPPQPGRIWKGTLGDQAITACFIDGLESGGVYYGDAALTPVRLSPPGDPAEGAARLQEDGSEAVWTLEAGENAIAGERRKGDTALPIRLAATPVDLPRYGSSCEAADFIAPLLAGGSFASTPASLGGTAYTVIAYKGPARGGLEGYQIQTFAIAPASPEDEAINAMLGAALPDDSASTAMGECYGMGLASGAPGSYIEEAQLPILISPRWVGVRQSGSSFCGGAHPNHFSTMAVYDRSTGAQVDPARWFKPGALTFYDFQPEPGQIRPIGGLSPRLMKAILARWPKDAERSDCDDVFGSGDSWVIGLTREGPVFVPQLPFVIFACTEEIVLPWKDARPFLSPEGRAVMASLK